MSIFYRRHESSSSSDSEVRQLRIARAEKIGLHILNQTPPGNRNSNATGYPLALPETQEILEQRRQASIALSDEED